MQRLLRELPASALLCAVAATDAFLWACVPAFDFWAVKSSAVSHPGAAPFVVLAVNVAFVVAMVFAGAVTVELCRRGISLSAYRTLGAKPRTSKPSARTAQKAA